MSRKPSEEPFFNLTSWFRQYQWGCGIRFLGIFSYFLSSGSSLGHCWQHSISTQLKRSRNIMCSHMRIQCPKYSKYSKVWISVILKMFDLKKLEVSWDHLCIANVKKIFVFLSSVITVEECDIYINVYTVYIYVYICYVYIYIYMFINIYIIYSFYTLSKKCYGFLN